MTQHQELTEEMLEEWTRCEECSEVLEKWLKKTLLRQYNEDNYRP